MIKHNDSHIDHGLASEQLSWLLERFAERDAFFIETVELPPELGGAPCALYGPLMGELPVTDTFYPDIYFAPRGDRKYDSKLLDRDPRVTRKVTVIAGPHDGHACVLYTAFGGPATPKEVGDPTLSGEDREASIKFWSEHALAVRRG